MRYFFILFLSTFTFSSDAFGDIHQQALIRAESYLSNLTKLQANFKQIDTNGHEVGGTFYLNRPGRLRFEYDAPIDDFIVADGTFIFYYDAELDQQTNTLIGQTLADFILRSELNLSEDVQVTNVGSQNGLISISMAQKEDPLAGSLTLKFTPTPFELKEWAISDPQGLQTRIILENINHTPSFEGVQFYYQNPKHGTQPHYNP